MRCFLLAFVPFCTAAAVTADTVTLTFDDLTDSWPADNTTFFEDGHTITSGPGLFGYDQQLHIDIALGPFALSYQITSTSGDLFDFLALDVLPIGTFSQFPDNPQDDLRIDGIRDGSVVATTHASSQDGGETVTGTPSFLGIDTLLLTGIRTQNINDRNDNGEYEDVHLAVDNIVLRAPSETAVVPLPATATLFGAALGCLTLLGRRHRRA